MSTSARIAYKTEDGSYKSIYCYYDGGLNVVGNTLQADFSEIADVMTLVDGGNISSIKDIKPTGTCLIHKTFEELILDHSRGDEFYLYVFEDNTWTYINAYCSEIIGKTKADMKNLKIIR